MGGGCGVEGAGWERGFGVFFAADVAHDGGCVDDVVLGVLLLVLWAPFYSLVDATGCS